MYIPRMHACTQTNTHTHTHTGTHTHAHTHTHMHTHTHTLSLSLSLSLSCTHIHTHTYTHTHTHTHTHTRNEKPSRNIWANLQLSVLYPSTVSSDQELVCKLNQLMWLRLQRKLVCGLQLCCVFNADWWLIWDMSSLSAVSYTHLTLPTRRTV